MIWAFSVLGALASLLLMSVHDVRTHTIKAWHLIPLWGVSCLYAAMTVSSAMDLMPLVLIACIFAVPCYFNFGLGDFLVLTGLWPFLVPVGSMWAFLIILLCVWGAVTAAVLIKARDPEKIKQYWTKQEIPLMPVITTAFILHSLLAL
jgi:hypothetical protein